jgi:hypothetical protein
MNAKQFTIGLFLSVFCLSCNKKLPDEAPEFPTSRYAYLAPVKYDGQRGFDYYLSENDKGTITAEESKAQYFYDEFSFVGELTFYASATKNEAIENAIDNYFIELIKEHPEEGESNKRTVYYCLDIINDVNIYCDKEFNGVETGKSLNSFFIISGDFIAKSNDNEYVVFFRDNILESSLLKKGQLIFPRKFDIRLKAKPQNEGIYTFTIEIKGNGISDRKEIWTIGLK